MGTESNFFCLVLEPLQSDQPHQLLDQLQSLLDHQLAMLKFNVNAEMSQFKYQELSKYQNVSQSQKPTVSQPPRLLQDHQLVTTNQDKSATQYLDKCHLKYL